MTVEFKMPELGEHVEAADLIKIMVSAGDRVAVDQPVLELETEKADFELPSPFHGVIREIHVRVGEKVKVGQLIFTLEEQVAEAGMPPVVAADQGRIETRQAPAIAAGNEVPAPTPQEPVSVRPAAPPEEPAPARTPVAATPTVRRLARELGVSIGEVAGSGPAGRILEEDVKALAKRIITSADREGAGTKRLTAALPDFARWGEIERKDMTSLRRKIAASMSQAWSDIPHVTHFESADITLLEKLRQKFAGDIEAAGGKLTITAIVVKVIASALKAFPTFAASLDMEREQIIIKKYCHIGVAVDTERGLIVPVIRDADKKNILELAVELARIADAARNKKITLAEIEGAVFTITNLGGIGGVQFSPIIHAPEVAILGISRARQEAVWSEGKFEPRLMLPLSLSYDHRLIDGADAARFLRWVVKAMEQPFLLPLEG